METCALLAEERSVWERTRAAAEMERYRAQLGRGGEGWGALTRRGGGEGKEEGRVGVRSDNRLKHHKQSRRREGRNLDWAHGKGDIFTEGFSPWC